MKIVIIGSSAAAISAAETLRKLNPDIKITRFEPFTLSPGKMAKKVVILETDKLLVDNNLKDTPITVTIKAYAKEDPEKVKVFRKATFFFPRSDKLQK